MECYNCRELLDNRMAVAGSLDWIVVVCPFCFRINVFSTIRKLEHQK